MPETRITYGLLVCVLLVCAPHAGHLPPWTSLLFAILLAWRAYLAYVNRPLPSRWLLLSLLAGSIAGILIGFHTLFGREAGVSFLILLSALKLLEVRSARDATVMIYLACFISITRFFYSQGILDALLMLATLWVVLATWIQLQSTALPLRPRLQMAGLLLLQAIPLTLVLFLLFPRVQGPLWGLPQDAYASSGLDDKMAPGSVGKLALSDAVAFRVMFDGQPPPRSRMYWRGPVLSSFDGHTWSAAPRGVPHLKPELESQDTPSDYTVTLEPHNKQWLFTLEMPTRVSIPATMTYDFQVQQTSPVTSRLRYSVHSQLGYRINAEEHPAQLQLALSLPRDSNPRAQQLAAGWRAATADDGAVVRSALAYFSREKFGYTLSPPPLQGNEIDDFLFETRKGFCEHYASAFVFLMRAAGIPARVVTGYQGGEYNGFGKYYILRQSDAHAWAEVWQRGRGWVRVDPTAAISPARVEMGVAAALPESDTASLPLLVRAQSPLTVNVPDWLLQLRGRLDVLNYQWNQWVLGYNPERQFAFLTRMGMEQITWQRMAYVLLGAMAVLAGLLTLLLLRQLNTQNADQVQRLYLRFCRKLARRGIVREPHEGPQDFAARAAQMKPQFASAIADITARYIALRYDGDSGPAALQGLRQAIRKL